MILLALARRQFYTVSEKPKKARFGSMSDTAYEAIRDLFLSNKLAPGQKLLYRDLENKLNMSKTPILNALNRLEKEGFVYLKKNAGYYIKEFTGQHVIQAFQAREILEVPNIDNVIENCTDSEIQKLRKAHQEYKNYAPHYFDRKKMLLNSQFHVQLAEIGGNIFLSRYIANIYNWFDFNLSFRELPPSRVTESAIEHGKILEAIEERNKAKAKKLMRKHIRSYPPSVLAAQIGK